MLLGVFTWHPEVHAGGCLQIKNMILRAGGVRNVSQRSRGHSGGKQYL